MNKLLFRYDVDGRVYPEYLKHGNACQFIVPTAQHYCKGQGVDVGPGKWPFPGAVPVDVDNSLVDAYSLPSPGPNCLGWDYVFSSHCLEHLPDPVRALTRWKNALCPGGCLFLYLPHPEMTYWRPAYCKKHLHIFYPSDVIEMLQVIGYTDVLYGERDLMWSFPIVAFNGAAA